MNTFKGDISFLNDCEYGQEIVDLMLTRQFEQTGKRDITVFEKARNEVFVWDKTVEGFNFWNEILWLRNPSHFRTVYPKKGEEKPLDHIDLIKWIESNFSYAGGDWYWKEDDEGINPLSASEIAELYNKQLLPQPPKH